MSLHASNVHSLLSMCTLPVLHQLHPASCTHHVPTSQIMVDTAQPPPVHPNELSPHFTHQTLILGIKHCCMLQHLLHLQDLFWECIPHGSSPPDSSRCIRTVPKVISICPQHCAELPVHFNICIWLISLLSLYFTYEITLPLFRCHPITFLAPFPRCLK